jgi:hypothetical protein
LLHGRPDARFHGRSGFLVGASDAVPFGAQEPLRKWHFLRDVGFQPSDFRHVSADGDAELLQEVISNTDILDKVGTETKPTDET